MCDHTTSNVTPLRLPCRTPCRQPPHAPTWTHMDPSLGPRLVRAAHGPLRPEANAASDEPPTASIWPAGTVRQSTPVSAESRGRYHPVRHAAWTVRVVYAVTCRSAGLRWC